ncbi:hypothetical protein CAP35_10485 [Chitinophagaceae bacterium IBVUCB1]|nr:hypothetical protein CAP35_10485 [Chitinophagaceae bacterium IBVUCB1]
MKLQDAKEKLHQWIDCANETQILTILSLVENIKYDVFQYDDATIVMLEKRSKEYLSDEAKTYTLEKSMNNIKNHRLNK